jgi:AcrR family transcriptional regulator
VDVTTGILSASSRDRILRAMAGLCAEQSYAETTVEQIVERAGVSSEAFFNLFDDVEGCMAASANAISAEVLAEVSSSYSADRSEWDSGLLGMKAILELMAAQPSFAYLGYIAARQMAPPRVCDIYRVGVQMLMMMIERLWEYSESPVQPAAAARGVLGGAEAVVRREIVAGRTEQLPRLLPDLAYGVTVPFLGQEEALRLAGRARELLAGSEWG